VKKTLTLPVYIKNTKEHENEILPIH
jgi:hypothetical protein